MKADYYRYIAEFRDGDAKSSASEKARQAYQEAEDPAYLCRQTFDRIQGVGCRVEDLGL